MAQLFVFVVLSEIGQRPVSDLSISTPPGAPVCVLVFISKYVAQHTVLAWCVVE